MGAGVIARAAKSEPMAIRQSLAAFPMQINDWRGQPGQPFEPRILAMLGVDEYVNRSYAHPKEYPVGLYIGYYQSQREGDAIHSPLNCLPGAGWEPISRATVTIPVRDGGAAQPGQGVARSITVNRYLIQKGADKQIVLYWYQSQGRVVASEYTSKVYMVWDAIRTSRTDAALVRIITPLRSADPFPEAAAEARAVGFAQSTFPLLAEYLPS
jgi:EpsI family protein